MQLSQEKIDELKDKYDHPNDFMCNWVTKYPTIKYATAEDAWVEFDKCFNVKYKAYWANKLRAKYADGNMAFSQHGR